MIMNKHTPRSFTWAGGILLAGFGLALLPLVPVRAQDPTPRGNVVPVQIAPAAPPQQKTPPSLDQKIEVLRRVLQQLEEQKRKQQGQAAPFKPAKPEEIKKARDEVERLTRQTAWFQAAARSSNARLQLARAKLAQLEAKSAGSRVLPRNVVPVTP